MNLTAGEFPDYFAAVHGHKPFAWQQRLLTQVLEEGWVRSISLPTASGKTAVLDIATFALAVEAGRPVAERRTPRRVALVVDRRIVVDDAFQRAERIQGALEDASTPILARVASALASLGGEKPLDSALLRGGIYREDRWARTPLQPVLLCSTVDQIGSRLLHRGYGLSPRTWPIHAGLLGHDALIILDEAHCSQPFEQTLTAIAQMRNRGTHLVPGPWSAISMTATPRGGLAPFQLNDSERAEPVLAQRLGASKRASVTVAKDKGDPGLVRAFLSALSDSGAGLLGNDLTTLIVVNRVRTARALFQSLRDRYSKGGADVILLTGRNRPIARDAVLERHRDRLAAGRVRSLGQGQPPLVVVATQCIEVGADLDVDALLSEAAPLDALRQRFGRLDRLGVRGSSSARIICRSELAGNANDSELPREVDIIYGAALTHTWWWMNAVADAMQLDFGVAALDQTLADHPPNQPLESPTCDAPLIFPEYCDLWAQTGPEPTATPEPAVFLHGPRSSPPDVGIVWRCDLDPTQPDSWADTIAACPPTAGEVLSIPIHTARAWLAGADSDPGSDLEGPDLAPKRDAQPGERRSALLWQGPEASRVVSGHEVWPGCTLVVPSTHGGADDMGWTGGFDETVQDLMERGRLNARRPAVLRVHPSLGAAFSADPPESWTTLAGYAVADDEGFSTDHDLREAITNALPNWAEPGVTTDVALTIEALRTETGRLRIMAHPSGRGLIITGSQRLGDLGRDFSDEDELSSLAPRGRVGLSAHLRDVEKWGRRFAKGVGLPDALVDAVALAGHLHDLGKSDPRFQVWLAGGDLGRVDFDRPAAKSAELKVGAASRLARLRAGYPEGGRHELLSVRLAESEPHLLPGDQLLRDLVLHLVASHHGHCRPFAPIVKDPRPLTVRYNHDGVELRASSETALERLDSGVSGRFWRLVRSYGWWGLAYLEACLRLADHRASERPDPDLEE